MSWSSKMISAKLVGVGDWCYGILIVLMVFSGMYYVDFYEDVDKDVDFIIDENG